MGRLVEEEVATSQLQLHPVHEVWIQQHHQSFHLLQVTTEHLQLDQPPLILRPQHLMAQLLIKLAFTPADFATFHRTCTQTFQQGLPVKATMLHRPSLHKDLEVVVVGPLLAPATCQLHLLPPDIPPLLLDLAWDIVATGLCKTLLELCGKPTKRRDQ